MYLNKKKYCYKSAFSLIEILIAIGIVSLILSLLYSMFFVTTQAVERSGYAVEELVEVNRFLEIVRQECEATNSPLRIQPHIRLGKKHYELSFKAHTGTIAGEVMLRYYVQAMQTGSVLRKEIRFRNGQKRDFIVLDNIEEFWVAQKEGKIVVTLSVRGDGSLREFSRTIKPMTGTIRITKEN